jgi:hypothetical protein
MITHGTAIRKLTWSMCTVNGTFVHFYKEDAIGMDIADFFLSFKKGSRRFRKKLGYEKKPMTWLN